MLKNGGTKQVRVRAGIFFLLLLGASYPVRGDILYSVTDLGSLGGPNSVTDAEAINNAGQVTGVSDGYAFLYSNGQMQNLGTLGGAVSEGFGINDAGQITGLSRFSSSSGDYHAFLYSNGQMQDLGTLAGSLSTGYGINNGGQVTGSAGDPPSTRVFLYSNGQMKDLGPGEGFGINNLGQITGVSPATSGASYAFLYTNGQMQNLGALAGDIGSIGYAINNSGQVTGISYLPGGGSRVFLYTNGQMQNLGTLGGIVGEGLAINDVGEVVGASAYSTVNNTVHAFLYINGQMLDLNSLINPALGLTLDDATGINDVGQIVADGTNNHAYLLTPLATAVPEPRTLALCGLALLGLGLRIRMRPKLTLPMNNST